MALLEMNVPFELITYFSFYLNMFRVNVFGYVMLYLRTSKFY